MRGAPQDRDRRPMPGAAVPGASGPLDGSTSTLDAALARSVADGRASEAATGRARGRWLEAQRSEEASLAALLVDLGERRVDAIVGTSGRRLVGLVVAVGRDVVALRLADGAHGVDALVALDAVDWVRAGAVRLPTGGREVETAVELAGVLAELAADRAEVTITTQGSEHLAGTLRAVGRDVVRLDLDGGAGSAAVRLGAVTEVRIRAR